jgi:hypothetical protein
MVVGFSKVAISGIRKAFGNGRFGTRSARHLSNGLANGDVTTSRKPRQKVR